MLLGLCHVVTLGIDTHLCDYAARYPEAFSLKSVDAENVAEALLTMFSRVGVPKEILTDQGTNFTSKLLAELYCLRRSRP